MKKIILLFSFLLVIASCSEPNPDFSAGYANGEDKPTEIKFTNTSTGADGYTWYFGDGGTTTEANPVHKFNAFGNVMVVLEAMKGGASARDTQYINIPEPPRKKVRIETKYGDMIAELYNTTPLHRDNFTRLIADSYYDSLLFHRVMDNFMIQGGDPDSKYAGPDQTLGMGSPAYTIPAEIGAPHYKGALAAARKGDQLNPEKRSSASQFYIVEGKPYSGIELANVANQYNIVYNQSQQDIYGKEGGTPFLDNQYTVFGMVIEGLEVIDSISPVKVNSANRPLEDIRMKITLVNE